MNEFLARRLVKDYVLSRRSGEFCQHCGGRLRDVLSEDRDCSWCMDDRKAFSECFASAMKNPYQAPDKFEYRDLMAGSKYLSWWMYTLNEELRGSHGGICFRHGLNTTFQYAEHFLYWLSKRRYLPEHLVHRINDHLHDKYHFGSWHRPPHGGMNMKYEHFSDGEFCPVDLATQRPAAVFGCAVCGTPCSVPVLGAREELHDRWEYDDPAHRFAGELKFDLKVDGTAVCGDEHCVEVAGWMNGDSEVAAEAKKLKVQPNRPTEATISEVPSEWRGALLASRYLDFYARLDSRREKTH